jgi:HSP20 family protein
VEKAYQFPRRNIMKKLLLSLVTASFLTTGALANSPFMNSDYEAEFQQMQNYLDSMVSTHLTRAKIANLGYPRLNVQDKNESYIYEFDLAGVPKENIKLSIDENNMLHLSGTKESKSEEKSQKYLKQEIFYGTFSRVIQLPDNIDQNRLETKYDNGILKLTIGKKAPKKVKSKLLEIN